MSNCVYILLGHSVYGAGTGTVRAVGQKQLESFENVVLEKGGEEYLARSYGK
jgi:hypothetical protein